MVIKLRNSNTMRTLITYYLLLITSPLCAQPSDSLIFRQLTDYGITFTTGNSVELLMSGQEKFDRMFADIRRARHTVHLEYFNFRNDSIAMLLFDILRKKRREGVIDYEPHRIAGAGDELLRWTAAHACAEHEVLGERLALGEQLDIERWVSQAMVRREEAPIGRAGQTDTRDLGRRSFELRESMEERLELIEVEHARCCGAEAEV